MMKPTLMALLGLSLAICADAAAQEPMLQPLDPAAARILDGSAPAGASATRAAPASSQDSGLVPIAMAGQSVPTTREFAAPRAAPPAMLPAGSRLSEALDRFVTSNGWSLRWQIDEDYILDANLPMPSNNLIEAVTWVVHTYQSQGGMPGVVPRFARSNNVVVIEKMDVRDSR